MISNCIDYLLSDLGQIEKDSLRRKDYDSAAEQWELSLMQRQYHVLKDQIRALHCGPSFVESVEMLRDNLAQKKASSIRMNLLMIKAYGAQTKLKVESR
jgi:hypothetical protein